MINCSYVSNIKQISNWDFCDKDDSPGDCSEGKVGKYLDLSLKIKSKGSPKEVDEDDRKKKSATLKMTMMMTMTMIRMKMKMMMTMMTALSYTTLVETRKCC